MHARPNCSECRGTGKVMLLLGSVPCNTCGGTEPSEWNCNPLDLILLRGGRPTHKMVCDAKTRWEGYQSVFIPLATYDCEGAPIQILPFLKAEGAVELEATLQLIVRPLQGMTLRYWERDEPESVFLRPDDFRAALLTINGPLCTGNLRAATNLMIESSKKVGRMELNLKLYPF